jgi:hypothetical protein
MTALPLLCSTVRRLPSALSPPCQHGGRARPSSTAAHPSPEARPRRLLCGGEARLPGPSGGATLVGPDRSGSPKPLTRNGFVCCSTPWRRPLGPPSLPSVLFYSGQQPHLRSPAVMKVQHPYTLFGRQQSSFCRPFLCIIRPSPRRL